MMENVKLNDIENGERIMNDGQSNLPGKSEKSYEAPPGAGNTVDEEHPVNNVVDEYPSVIRRTIIVIGVALALFCVSRKFRNSRT